MPNVSLTEFAPEVASRPADKRAKEPVRETTSTLGRFSEKEEEDKVTISCKNLQSALTTEASIQIVRQYNLEVVVPSNWKGCTILRMVTLLCQRPTSNSE